MTEEGGIQQVVAKDAADSDQIKVIQQHLRNEADRFQRGDFSDPATLHRENMRGLKELQDGAPHIAIRKPSFPQARKSRSQRGSCIWWPRSIDGSERNCPSTGRRHLPLK
jgi:hypothetical protein